LTRYQHEEGLPLHEIWSTEYQPPSTVPSSEFDPKAIHERSLLAEFGFGYVQQAKLREDKRLRKMIKKSKHHSRKRSSSSSDSSRDRKRDKKKRKDKKKSKKHHHKRKHSSSSSSDDY